MMYRLGQKRHDAMATEHNAYLATPNPDQQRRCVSKRHTTASSINGATQNAFTKEHLNKSDA
jgi:hypothetical protein